MDTSATHILVKGQGHTKVKNAHNMLSHGYTTIIYYRYQILYAYDDLAHTQIHGESIILTLRSKVKVIQGS